MITGWKIICGDVILTEDTVYGDNIKAMSMDLGWPDNTLSLAKMQALQIGLPTVMFEWEGCEVAIPSDKLSTFNPFVRAGSAPGQDVNSGDCFYLLDGREHSLKKKIRFYQK